MRKPQLINISWAFLFITITDVTKYFGYTAEFSGKVSFYEIYNKLCV